MTAEFPWESCSLCVCSSLTSPWLFPPFVKRAPGSQLGPERPEVRQHPDASVQREGQATDRPLPCAACPAVRAQRGPPAVVAGKGEAARGRRPWLVTRRLLNTLNSTARLQNIQECLNMNALTFIYSPSKHLLRKEPCSRNSHISVLRELKCMGGGRQMITKQIHFFLHL